MPPAPVFDDETDEEELEEYDPALEAEIEAAAVARDLVEVPDPPPPGALTAAFARGRTAIVRTAILLPSIVGVFGIVAAGGAAAGASGFLPSTLGASLGKTSYDCLLAVVVLGCVGVLATGAAGAASESVDGHARERGRAEAERERRAARREADRKRREAAVREAARDAAWEAAERAAAERAAAESRRLLEVRAAVDATRRAVAEREAAEARDRAFVSGVSAARPRQPGGGQDAAESAEHAGRGDAAPRSTR
jgi:hypothetical protein